LKKLIIFQSYIVMEKCYSPSTMNAHTVTFRVLRNKENSRFNLSIYLKLH